MSSIVCRSLPLFIVNNAEFRKYFRYEVPVQHGTVVKKILKSVKMAELRISAEMKQKGVLFVRWFVIQCYTFCFGDRLMLCKTKLSYISAASSIFFLTSIAVVIRILFMMTLKISR